MPSHREYTAPSGALWRIEDAESLLAEFSLDPELLPSWHARMTGQGLMWNVIVGYYGVGRAIDAVEVRSPEELAKEYGITTADVDREVDKAVAHWRLVSGALHDPAHPVAGGTDPAPGGKVASDEDRGLARSAGLEGGLDETRIDRVLASHHFDDLTSPVERRMAAARLVDLHDLMADPQTSQLASTLVRQELDLHFLNGALTKARSAAADLSKPKQVTDLLEQRDKALAKYHATMREITEIRGPMAGAGDREEFRLCLGLMTAAAQAYYGKAENRLVDGMYTAAEVDFMLRPVAERESPYDPAVVVQTYRAQLDLWHAGEAGSKVNQGQNRRLRKAFAAAIDEANGEADLGERSLEEAAGLDADEESEAFAHDSATATGQALPGEMGVTTADPETQARQVAFQSRAAGGDFLAAG